MGIGRRSNIGAILIVLSLSLAGIAVGREPLLQDLPPGVSIEKEDLIPAAPREAVAQKLGGVQIERLTNAYLKVNGRTGRLNLITALDGHMPIVYVAMPRIEVIGDE